MTQSRSAIRALIVWFHLVADPGRCSSLMELPLIPEGARIEREVAKLMRIFGDDARTEAIVERRSARFGRRQAVATEIQHWRVWLVARLDVQGVSEDLLVLPADRLRDGEIDGILGVIGDLDLPVPDRLKQIVEQERRSPSPRSIAFTVSNGEQPNVLGDYEASLIRALMQIAAQEDVRLSAA